MTAPRALWACAVVIAALARVAIAAHPALLRGLDTDDATALSAAVGAIEAAPPGPGLADVLFAAGRACEDRLHDPARALALYERIVREAPDAGVAIAAERRAVALRGIRTHAREAGDLAQLIAHADALPPGEVVRRADVLAAAEWPGALDAALWLADWMCRTRRDDDADLRYAALVARAPTSAQAAVARRNAAGCAIDAGNWERARARAETLPRGIAVDDAVRANLLDAARAGQARARLYVIAWIGLAVAALALLGSLVEACVRGGPRTPAWAPPLEVIYFAPIAAVMIAATFAIDRALAPSVTRICGAGLALAWLSGATLDLLRARGRAVRARAIAQVVACALGVLATGYISIWRDGLIDMFSETVRYGPGA